MKNAARLVILILIMLSIAFASFPASANGWKPYHFGFEKSSGGKLPSIAQKGFLVTLKKHGAAIQTKRSYI